MCIDLGWTKDQALDQLDVPFLQALNEQWRQAPALRRIAAAYAGYKPPRKRTGGVPALPHFA